MARIPTWQKIIPSRFESDDQPLVTRLAGYLNKIIDDVNRALTNRLTIADNLDGAIEGITVDGNYPVTISASTQPKAVLIGRVSRRDRQDPTYTGAISLNWVYNENGIQILDVVGLDDSSSLKYDINLVILNG